MLYILSSAVWAILVGVLVCERSNPHPTATLRTLAHPGACVDLVKPIAFGLHLLARGAGSVVAIITVKHLISLISTDNPSAPYLGQSAHRL